MTTKDVVCQETVFNWMVFGFFFFVHFILSTNYAHRYWSLFICVVQFSLFFFSRFLILVMFSCGVKHETETLFKLYNHPKILRSWIFQPNPCIFGAHHRLSFSFVRQDDVFNCIFLVCTWCIFILAIGIWHVSNEDCNNVIDVINNKDISIGSSIEYVQRITIHSKLR